MKINWKKRYEDESENYRDYVREHQNHWDRSEKWLYSILIVWAVSFLILLPLALFGVFDSPIERLGLDKNELVREHTLKYYPEFENCSIEYNGCLNDKIRCKDGVEVYCDKLDSRNNLKVQRETKPTEVLYLDGITLEDILLDIIKRR